MAVPKYIQSSKHIMAEKKAAGLVMAKEKAK